jgi:ABC-type nitrate/sulfonate/bicarbonate transport system substrate-binding protein
VLAAIARGQAEVVADPEAALADLLEAVPELSPADQRAQLDALLAADAIGPGVALDASVLRRWARWDAEHGIVDRPPPIERAFALGLGAS